MEHSYVKMSVKHSNHSNICWIPVSEMIHVRLVRLACYIFLLTIYNCCQSSYRQNFRALTLLQQKRQKVRVELAPSQDCILWGEQPDIPGEVRKDFHYIPIDRLLGCQWVSLELCQLQHKFKEIQGCLGAGKKGVVFGMDSCCYSSLSLPCPAYSQPQPPMILP